MIRKRADRGRERERERERGKGEPEERHSGDKRTGMMSEASVRRGGERSNGRLVCIIIIIHYSLFIYGVLFNASIMIDSKDEGHR